MLASDIGYPGMWVLAVSTCLPTKYPYQMSKPVD